MQNTPEPSTARQSIDRFLAWESRQPRRHEYAAGVVHAMTGGTVRHSLLTLNLVRLLHGPSRARRCVVVASDVPLLAAVDRVYYPDVMLACGGTSQDERLIERPVLVAEVTSPSTRATDQREKVEAYCRLDSLRLYLIIDQRRRHVVAYARDSVEQPWQRTEYAGLDEQIAVPTFDCTFTVGSLYEGVELPPLMVREEFTAWAEDDDAARELDDLWDTQ
jgi:Uma2 family endonuclease